MPYSASSNGTKTVTIPAIATAGTYTYHVRYVTNDHGCISVLVSFLIVVSATPAAPTARSIAICQGGRDVTVYSLVPSDVVTLTASGAAGSVITWYSDSAGTTALQVGSLICALYQCSSRYLHVLRRTKC